MLSESAIVRILLRDRIQIQAYIDSFINDSASSEDCYQDVCAAAVAKGDYFEDETHVFRWALRVGRNKAVDLCRKRSREPVLLDSDVLEMLEAQWEGQQTAGSGFQDDRIVSLRKCLAQLTDSSKRVLHLRYVDGMKTGRIASLLDRKVETVYQTLTRAHAALRKCMEKKTPNCSLNETI